MLNKWFNVGFIKYVAQLVPLSYGREVLICCCSWRFSSIRAMIWLGERERDAILVLGSSIEETLGLITYQFFRITRLRDVTRINPKPWNISYMCHMSYIFNIWLIYNWCKTKPLTFKSNNLSLECESSTSYTILHIEGLFHPSNFDKFTISSTSVFIYIYIMEVYKAIDNFFKHERKRNIKRMKVHKHAHYHVITISLSHHHLPFLFLSLLFFFLIRNLHIYSKKAN